MRTLLKFFILFFLTCMVAACDNSDDPEFDSITFKNDASKEITMGFNVHFTGEYLYQGPDQSICGDFPPFARVNNVGEGTGTHFKKLKSYFDFCVNITDGTYPYDYMEAYFEDENGDRLNVAIYSGQVLPGRVPGMPSFALSYFKDPFEIIGGTGKFEGATGSGFTNDYNFQGKDGIGYTQHHWQGKITLIKGKKK